MKTSEKLSAADRRQAIIRAVRRVFAERGFEGTTTKALADAAGVSEALLFKHFPTKEALFVAMKQSCCSEQDTATSERLQALEPSASTLVLLVHFLVTRVIGGADAEAERRDQNRLILRSLAGDGEFARILHRTFTGGWIAKVSESLRAAIVAGEAVEGPFRANLGAWFVHHLAAAILFYRLPEPPVVDDDVSRQELATQAVWFALRGLGLKEAAIRRHYNPRALALLDGRPGQ
jgi:AcrR family transcriptional regulator